MDEPSIGRSLRGYQEAIGGFPAEDQRRTIPAAKKNQIPIESVVLTLTKASRCYKIPQHVEPRDELIGLRIDHFFYALNNLFRGISIVPRLAFILLWFLCFAE